MQRFWNGLDKLLATCTLVIDRPKGTRHPRHPSLIYPLDYGYLEGSCASDGEGVDVWVGSLPEKRLNAIVCTIDMTKRDTELKLLLGCSEEDSRKILEVHNWGLISATLFWRPNQDKESAEIRRTPDVRI